MALALPDKATQVEATSTTKASARKRAAAPEWSDLVSAFGPQGLERDTSGAIKGYRYPQPKDDEDRKRINNKVYELWNPQRKIATDLGGERNAKVPSTTLLDRKTGKREVVPAHLAESKAKKVGMVEAPHWKGRRVMVADSNGKLWRLVGTEYVEA